MQVRLRKPHAFSLHHLLPPASGIRTAGDCVFHGAVAGSETLIHCSYTVLIDSDRERRRLVDTRPGEKTPGSPRGGPSGAEGRTITWTLYYPKADTYSRVDFILLSPGMAREWVKDETYVLASPEWGTASDHCPLVAAFEAEDK